MHPSAVRGLARYDWDGKNVVFNPVVPSSRPVVGGKRQYAIDVREFLVTERNAVVRAEIDTRIRKHLAATPGAWERFTARARTCFDYRASVVAAWVGQQIKYAAKRGRDPWQFPDETLALRAGDCEDRAFLIASLLLACGVSGYHVRAVLGHVRVSSGRRFDHAWVMYKSEAGRWLLIDPLLTHKGRTNAAPGKKKATSRRTRERPLPSGYRPHDATVEYVPEFLFNADHLWSAMPGQSSSFEQVASRTWRKMNPKFVGVVHQTILHKALSDIVPPQMLAELDARFSPAVLGAVGPTVDDSDRGPYDPLDHFDNGLIDESWALVEKRISQFRSNQSDYLSFAQAAHGVADFYAHSSYAHFAWVQGPPAAPEPHAEPYDPARLSELLHDAPDYGPGDGPTNFDLTSDRFSVNTRLWKKGKQAAADSWSGRLISGRYGQPGDSKGDLVHRLFIEGPASLPRKYLTPAAGSLPHHIEIAVDDLQPDADHRLYDRGFDYELQYRIRVNTAAAHIRKMFLEAWNG